jgi:serine/threonine protein kinase
MSFNNIQLLFPKYVSHFTKASVKECVHSLAQAEKKGKTLVSFFKEAVESKKWKENHELRSFLKEAGKIAPEESKLSKDNKSTIQKIQKTFKEKVEKHKKKQTETALKKLPQNLQTLTSQNQEQREQVKQSLQLALKGDFAKTLKLIKDTHSDDALQALLPLLKELATKGPSLGINKENCAVLQRICDCYEALFTSNQTTKKFSNRELLKIAILTQNEIPKIKKVKDKILASGKEKIKKGDLDLPYDLYVNAKKKKIYVLTPHKLGEGGFKKVVAAVGFTFQNSQLVNPRLVAFAETKANDAQVAMMKKEVAIAKQVKDVDGILEPRLATVQNTRKGARMIMITDICEGDLDYTIKNGQLSIKDRVQIIKDAASAVKGFHEKGYAHNDLKPWNFLVKNKRAKLIDFGVSYPLHHANRGHLGCYGTVVYNSPEALTGYTNHTPAQADVFALGLTLWDLISMQKPMWSKWEGTVNNFILNYSLGISLRDGVEKDRLYALIQNECRGRIQELERKPDQTTDDRALLQCAKTIEKMLLPVSARISMSQAHQELQAIV